MKNRNIALAAGVALVCALSACGGGGDGSAQTQPVTAVTTASAPVQVVPSAQAASAPAPASTPVSASKAALIEVNGDDSMFGVTSIGYGTPTITQQSEPADSQALLRAQFGDGVTIINHAEGGRASTLVNMMAGVDGGGPPFAERVKTSKADIVLVNHAVNDDLSQSLGPYTDALVAWVQAVRAAGKIPVLEEPNPVCDSGHPNLQNYVSTMDNIAAAYNVPLVKQFDYLQTIPNYCSHLSGGLYPDDAIYAIKAQREAAVLGPIVAAALSK